MAFSSAVTQDAVIGNPAPSYKLEWQDNAGGPVPCYLARDFGVDAAAIVMLGADFRVNDVGGLSRAGFGILRDSSGNGVAVAVNGVSGAWTISLGLAASWGVYGAMTANAALTALAADTWFRMEISATKNADNTSTIKAEVFDSTSVSMGSVTGTVAASGGGFCGFYSLFDQLGSASNMYVDNIQVQGSGALDNITTNVATAYVYTFVNDLGEESAPSLASATVLRPDGVSVTVTTPTGVPTGISLDYEIETKRIYRATTGNAGSAYRFVAEIPLAQADYLDNLQDNELEGNELLPSTIWALPPDDLEGILALPNGVMVGFRRNQLCFSAQNQPHAWPVQYRLNTDTDIVGIANVDTTVVIGTKSFVYVASGNDPANYSMSKFEVPQAASSKRSFSYVTGLGVVFSSPDGLMAVAGIGQIRNLTQNVFTRRQWQALDPTSIFAVAHNDIYFFFWENGSAKGCFAVDLRQDGFGVVELAFHATAAYVDPIEDKMYLVLDQDNEPDDALLPVHPVLPSVIDSKTIYEFEGNDAVLMTYRYRSKLWLNQYPSFFIYARIRAKTYDNTVVRFYGDGVLLDTIVIEGETVFTLTPPDEAYDTFEMEVLGTDDVRVVAAGDTATDLP